MACHYTEYVERKARPFQPPNVTISQLRAVIPPYLFRKCTVKGLAYVARDVAMIVGLYYVTRFIDPLCESLSPDNSRLSSALKVLLWMAYWFWQGICCAGIWVIGEPYLSPKTRQAQLCIASRSGHEAGHMCLSPHVWANHVIGFFVHTSLFAPYFSWRASHIHHHKSTNSMEHDEHF